MSQAAKQLFALSWKEWRESRWLLATGLFVLLGLPLVHAAQGVAIDHRTFDVEPAPWVMLLGGLLAMVVGTAAGGRDLTGKVDDFWRSRPVGVGRWAAVKFAAGLLVVLASCLIPLAVELATPHRTHHDPYLAGGMVIWGPPLWAALYGVGFLVACLVRRPAHAALLAVAGLAFVYLAPIAVPQLRTIGVPWVLERSRASYLSEGGGYSRTPSPIAFHREQLAFVLTMVGVAAAAFVVGLVALGRQWEVRSGRRMLFGLAGTSMFALFATASIQQGSSLPVLREISLDPGERAVAIKMDGGIGVMATTARPGVSEIDALRTVRATPDGVTLGPLVNLLGLDGRGQGFPLSYGTPERSFAWSAARPDIVYLIDVRTDRPSRLDAELVIVSIAPGSPGGTVLSRLPLYSVKPDAEGVMPYVGHVPMSLLGNHLHTYSWVNDRENWWRAVDVSDPARPSMLPGIIDMSATRPAGERDPHLTYYRVLPDTGGAMVERLEWWNGTGLKVDGDVLFKRGQGDSLTVSKVANISRDWVEAREVSRYDRSLVEQYFGGSIVLDAVGGGRVYTGAISSSGGRTRTRITALDVRDPGSPKPAGHFAVTSESQVVVGPLPDGRALIGGDKLYLVGPLP